MTEISQPEEIRAEEIDPHIGVTSVIVLEGVKPRWEGMRYALTVNGVYVNQIALDVYAKRRPDGREDLIERFWLEGDWEEVPLPKIILDLKELEKLAAQVDHRNRRHLPALVALHVLVRRGVRIHITLTHVPQDAQQEDPRIMGELHVVLHVMGGKTFQSTSLLEEDDDGAFLSLNT